MPFKSVSSYKANCGLLASLCIGFLCLSTQFASAQAVVGIFGDLHGDQRIAESVLLQMKQHGVTHIIGTGDFIRFEGPSLLKDILSKITPLTGIPKQNIFLFPGNWEHETGFAADDMNRIMSKFGNLVFENYDGFGFVNVQGEKIMVSHFPQHKVPDEFLPPPEFRKRMEGQAYVMDTIERGILPPGDVVFEIFAHTHIGGAFWDWSSGKLVVNAGVLDFKTKGPTEPRAYAIYFQDKNEIAFNDADRKTELARISVLTPPHDHEASCEPMLLRNSIKL